MNSLNWVWDVLNHIQHNLYILPVIIVTGAFIWSAVLNNSKKLDEGVYPAIIIILALIFYICGVEAEDIFQSSSDIYKSMFIGLSIELFGVICTMVTIELIKGDVPLLNRLEWGVLSAKEATNTISIIVSMAIIWAIVFILSFYLLETQKIVHLIDNTKNILPITEEVVFNLSIELFSNSVIPLIICATLLVIYPPICWCKGTIQTATMLACLAFGTILFITFVHMIKINTLTLLNEHTILQILIAFLGAFVAIVTGLEWSKPSWESLIYIFFLFFLFGLIVIFNIFGPELSMGISIEFFGAAFITVIKEKGWSKSISSHPNYAWFY